MPRILISFILGITIFLGLLSINSYCQIDVRKFDYHIADSIALNYCPNKSVSYKIIAGDLTKNLDTEHEKCRAIFRWIAENIAYSYAAKSTKPELVVKSRIAVCSGYAELFKAMCDIARVESIIIPRYVKTKITQIGKKWKSSNHDWNAVKLHKKWYLIDATWARGYHLLGSKTMVKEYNETYFLSTAEFFFKTHYPDKKKHFFGEEYSV